MDLVALFARAATLKQRFQLLHSLSAGVLRFCGSVIHHPVAAVELHRVGVVRARKADGSEVRGHFAASTAI